MHRIQKWNLYHPHYSFIYTLLFNCIYINSSWVFVGPITSPGHFSIIYVPGASVIRCFDKKKSLSDNIIHFHDWLVSRALLSVSLLFRYLAACLLIICAAALQIKLITQRRGGLNFSQHIKRLALTRSQAANVKNKPQPSALLLSASSSHDFCATINLFNILSDRSSDVAASCNLNT